MKTMLGAYFMEIFFKNNLNSSDQLQIGQLLSAPTADSAANTEACFVPTPALADILDADQLVVCYAGKGSSLGCMAVYQTGDDSFECVPFVHPDFRRKGIFSCDPWLLPVKKTGSLEKVLCIFPAVLKMNHGKIFWGILEQNMPGMNIC